MKGWGTKSKWVLLYCSALFVKYKFNSDYVNQNLNFAVLLNAANQFEWTKKMMFFLHIYNNVAHLQNNLVY